MKLLAIISAIILCGSCTESKISDDSIRELIQTVRQNNNYNLSEYRDGNELLKKVKISSTDLAEENLIIIDRLLKLNNSTPPKYELINDFIKEERLNSEENCPSSLSAKTINNDIEYFNLLNKIIKESCIDPGSINEPRLLMNYTISGKSFRTQRGESFEVPLKAFPQISLGEFEYILFDTLEFKTVSSYEGSYSVNSSSLNIGLNKEKLSVYGKDIYTGKTEKVGTIEFDVEVFENGYD